MIGNTLGGYRIVEQVGRGGMATVYKAFDPLTERHVAIKTLPQQYLQDETFRARFEQEAKSIARLEHVHILPMFAFGEEDGITYMVMRYLDTGTLSEYIQANGALPLAEAAQILNQVASALSYAHQNNVLHRDVKPSNVLMDDQGNAFLTDFGIAKMVDGSGLDLTGTGLIGTPKYMSPEQCLGKKDLTSASDQYSLGIILYEMITGQAPFDAETPLAVIQQHVSAPLTPPQTYRRDLPEIAQNVLLKALAREPEARYDSCNNFAQAFADAIPSSRDSPLNFDDDFTMIPSVDATATLAEWESESATTVIQPKGNDAGRRGLWLGGLVAIILIGLTFGVLTMLGDDKNSDESTLPPANTDVVENPTAVSTDTLEPTVTATNEPEPSATYTDEPSLPRNETDTPTIEPTEVSVVVDQYTAMDRVAINADWEPIIHEFEYDGYTVPMALVPRGCYTMGNDPDSAYYDLNQREVWQLGVSNGGRICFDRPFWIDVYEVSNEQFNTLNGAANLDSEWSDGELPREKIAWREALTFCTDNRDARLPTEAEWEYAARGPDNLYVPWTNSLDMYEDVDTPPLNYCEGDCYDYFFYDWADRERNDGFAGTGSISAYPEGVSWVGALNINGNVWEWVSTIYDLQEYPYPYDAEDSRENLDENFVSRGLRGGSYEGTPDKVRSTTRYGLSMLSAQRTIGFRCSRDYTGIPE